MLSTTPDKNEKWLREALPKHERLTTAVHSLLENMLQKDGIEHLNVTSRVKDCDHAVEKIRRKAYTKPKVQLTDLSGIRVVTYLEGEVAQISKIIRDLFEVDEANSLDRSASLGPDRIGYRSTHFVCTLGNKRDILPEYEALGGLKFEIQVRTVLQHAWAELAHDRSFKFGAALPQKIERKLNLYSGLLEIVDGAFDDISKEIDRYKDNLDRQNLKQLSSAEIDSISLNKFVRDLLPKIGLVTKDRGVAPEVVDEIRRMNLKSIGEMEKMSTNEFLDHSRKHMKFLTPTGFLRTMLIYNDPDKYFQQRPRWDAIPVDAFETITAKHPQK